MRPLVVLLLVLASLTALLVALTSLSDPDRQVDSGPGPVTTPLDVERQPELVMPPQPEIAETTREEPEETRQALRPDRDPSGRKVAFGAIHGTVMDANGSPIPEADVSLLNARPSALGDDLYLLRGEDPPRPVSVMVTQEGGEFRFDQLDPRKDWSLVVTHEKYLTYTTELAIPVPEGGVWEETVILEPGQICQGVVRDAKNGQPIAGAVLVVDGPFARMSKRKSPGRLEAMTDTNGVYVFPNVGASFGQARILTVSAAGYATQVHNNFAMASLGEVSTKFKNKQGRAPLVGRQQDFELEPGRVIAGRVVGPDQRGVAGIEVEALSQSGTVSSQGTAKSGPKGEFLIEGLAEGIYTVRVNATNYDANPLQRVEAGDTNVRIELFEHATVTGRVVDPEGHGLPSFVVKARMANEIGKAFGSVAAQRSVKGSKDGSFELRGVPEGSYVIEALAEGYASSFSDTFSATQGLVTSDVLVRMSRGGSLGGLILQDFDNSPIAGAEVSTEDNDFIDGQIWDLFGTLEPTAMTKTKTFTDANGRFEFDVVTPGPYQLRIKARGYSPLAVKDVLVVEGQHTELPPLLLIKGSMIRGVVYGADRSPQPGASVQLTAGDFGSEGRMTRTDAMGRFVIDNARPGTYKLSATRPSSGTSSPFETIADMRQTEIEISVENGKTYEFDLHLGSARGN
jgi:protocatechuate 3,4-dioxygenase beta subunit